MCILESVREYFLLCPYLKQGRMNVDYLGAEPGEYTIDEVPSTPLIKLYLDGSALKQFSFVLASREAYSSDTVQNLLNHGFYEKVATWLKEQNARRSFPALADGRAARKLEATTGGYAFKTGINSARYQMQCRLLYFEKGLR